MRTMLTFEVIYDYMMNVSETGRAQLEGKKKDYQYKGDVWELGQCSNKEMQKIFPYLDFKKNARILELYIPHTKPKPGVLPAGYFAL